MAVQLGPALKRFKADCSSTLAWLGATEALWMTAPPTTDVRRQLKTPQMEALYEAAYLRVFTAWEVFQEETTVRMMAGAVTPSYRPVPAQGHGLHRTQVSARQALYGNRDYLLWHNPSQVRTRVAKFIAGSPLEAELLAKQGWLENVSHIRHRVAHASDDASKKFQQASHSLTGTAHVLPGRLLRAYDMSDALNTPRWIYVIARDLQELATRCAS